MDSKKTYIPRIDLEKYPQLKAAIEAGQVLSTSPSFPEIKGKPADAKTIYFLKKMRFIGDFPP